MKIILVSIIVIPFIEIYLLLEIGGLIGALPTIFFVLFTAALGFWLLRQQGFATFQRFRESIARGEIPAYEVIEGPIILLGGILLLTPGFLTDIIGLVCLIPPLRKRLAQYILEKHFIQASGFFGQQGIEKTVLEGDFRREE